MAWHPPPHLQAVADEMDVQMEQRRLRSAREHQVIAWDEGRGIDRTFIYTREYARQRTEIAREMQNLAHITEIARWPMPPVASEMSNEDVAAAKQKATQLLQDVLPAADWATFQKKSYFEVSGKWWLYRVSVTGQTHVRSLTCGCLKATACLQVDQPGEAHPVQDRMVAEYLLLKNDERKYLDTANLSWYDPEEKEAFMMEREKRRMMEYYYAQPLPMSQTPYPWTGPTFT